MTTLLLFFGHKIFVLNDPEVNENGFDKHENLLHRQVDVEFIK